MTKSDSFFPTNLYFSGTVKARNPDFLCNSHICTLWGGLVNGKVCFLCFCFFLFWESYAYLQNSLKCAMRQFDMLITAL